ARAFAFLRSAAVKYAGTNTGFAARFTVFFFGASARVAASFTMATISRCDGRSSIDVILRNGFTSTLAGLRPVQNTHPQCCLNAAVMQRMPRSSTYAGTPHLIVSSTKGCPLCTAARICFRIGFAKSFALAMYASTLGSFVAISLLEFGIWDLGFGIWDF